MGQQPHERIWNLATASVVSRTLHVIAELGVADQVGESPVSAKQLAVACGADPGALERALLLLVAHDVFESRPDGFAHNDASRLLRRDGPMSMRAFPRMMGMASFTASFAELEHSIRTGRPAFDLVAPDGLFAHLQQDAHEADVFAAAMTAKAAADIDAVLAAYDLQRFSTIADIGGGQGHLLRAALEAAPESHGILFDLPEVIAALDTDHGNERLVLQAGDFFVDTLPGADVHVLMEILHDWDDARAAAILAAVRRAASPGGTVLVIEAVADGERADPVVHTLDMIMLAITGGRERSSDELRGLFGGAGFELAHVHETRAALRIVEAVAV